MSAMARPVTSTAAREQITETAPGDPRRAAYQRIGAAEARWAHNPKVPGSKPGFATFLRLDGRAVQGASLRH